MSTPVARDVAGHVFPEAVRTKALAILRDGRLRVMSVRTAASGLLTHFDGIVYGHRAEHAVGFTRRDGEPWWTCTCSDEPPCPHVFAAEMVAHGVWGPGRDGAPKCRPVRKASPRG